MLTTIPFSGFYGSGHDDELDQALDRMFTDRATGCEVNTDLRDRAYDACHWPKVFDRYAKVYAEALANECEIDMTFESLRSPREYNFSTDLIFCQISLEEVRRLRAETNEKNLRDTIRERFTSRSGFHSFYSNDLDHWDEIETWDHNEVGTLLEAYIQQVCDGAFNWESEMALMEMAQGNGYFDTWISNATPGISRLFAIHDYLENRKERAA